MRDIYTAIDINTSGSTGPDPAYTSSGPSSVYPLLLYRIRHQATTRQTVSYTQLAAADDQQLLLRASFPSHVQLRMLVVESLRAIMHDALSLLGPLLLPKRPRNECYSACRA